MGRFEFRSNDIMLDFAGIEVKVPGTIEYTKKLEELGRKMVVWGNDPANEKADDEAAKDFMLEVLDELLGEEAMDAIEEKKELNLYDCCDMFKYIKEEVMAYHNGVVESHTKQPVPMGHQPMAVAAVENRAARRARQRAKCKNF